MHLIEFLLWKIKCYIYTNSIKKKIQIPLIFLAKILLIN